MRYSRILSLLLTLILFSCCKQSGKNSICKIDFYYFYSRFVYESSSIAIPEISFVFYVQYFKNCSDKLSNKFHSIEIVVPETDSVFNLTCDSIHHTFTHTFKNNKGHIITEKIKTGEIEGKRLTKYLWEIRVKTKPFDFKKLIYTKESRNAYYERFTTCE